MIGFIYTERFEASKNMKESLFRNHRFEENGSAALVSEENKDIAVFKSDSLLFDAESIDGLHLDVAYFLSPHESKAGVSAMTTHSMGNWGSESAFGGMPGQLSVAAPLDMLSVLQKFYKNETGHDIEKTYEATHHGPLVSTPSLFVELGGNESMLGSKALAEKVAESAYGAALDSLGSSIDYEKIVIGIGGNHYPEKFTKLAVEKNYAFSHIMPRYAINKSGADKVMNILEQAADRSRPTPESAVIEWKSIKGEQRELVLKKLEEMGFDYEKI